VNIHTTSLALIETDALTPAVKSARVVSVALESCSVERMRSSWADVHSESGKGLAEVDRELLRRAGIVTKPGEDKGAR